YWHHAVRAGTCMFSRSFAALVSALDLDHLFRQGEAEFIRTLQEAATGTNVAPLLDGVFGPSRRLHKRVLEFSHAQEPALYGALAGRPYRELWELNDRLTARVAERLGRSLAP